MIRSEAGTAVKKVNPQPVAEYGLISAPSVVWMPRVTQQTTRSMHPERLVPDDLIVLCERWLI